MLASDYIERHTSMGLFPLNIYLWVAGYPTSCPIEYPGNKLPRYGSPTYNSMKLDSVYEVYPRLIHVYKIIITISQLVTWSSRHMVMLSHSQLISSRMSCLTVNSSVVTSKHITKPSACYICICVFHFLVTQVLFLKFFYAA